MTVIVTDHHEVPYEESGGERRYLMPPADVVIDPKQEGDNYPYKGICGAVVAYKVIMSFSGGWGWRKGRVRFWKNYWSWRRSPRYVTSWSFWMKTG